MEGKRNIKGERKKNEGETDKEQRLIQLFGERRGSFNVNLPVSFTPFLFLEVNEESTCLEVRNKELVLLEQSIARLISIYLMTL